MLGLVRVQLDERRVVKVQIQTFGRGIQTGEREEGRCRGGAESRLSCQAITPTCCNFLQYTYLYSYHIHFYIGAVHALLICWNDEATLMMMMTMMMMRRMMMMMMMIMMMMMMMMMMNDE